jgi:hypothetical protein
MVSIKDDSIAQWELWYDRCVVRVAWCFVLIADSVRLTHFMLARVAKQDIGTKMHQK